MPAKMRTVARAAPDDTKNQIKAAAQMLFARHGVDAVTVQQIVTAAGSVTTPRCIIISDRRKN